MRFRFLGKTWLWEVGAFCAILLVGCAMRESAYTPPLPSSMAQQSSRRQSSSSSRPRLEVINKELFFYGKKRGWVEGKRVFIPFEDAVYSFDAVHGVDSLRFFDWSGVEDVVQYGDLNIYLPTTKRYYAPWYRAMFHNPADVVFQCDGPFIAGQPFAYCSTNGSDTLEQYEFGRDFRQFQTGGGFDLYWRKYFATNMEGTTVVFEGKLEGWHLDSDTSFVLMGDFGLYEELRRYGLIENLGIDPKAAERPPYDEEQRRSFKQELARVKNPEQLKERMEQIVSSKEYLDKIRTETSNIEKERKWRTIMNTFAVSK